ncbi:MAG: ABC transporter permease [Hyphomicrobium sp.]
MSGIFGVMTTALRNVFTVRPAFTTMILAVIVYAALYPQPYLNEALRNVPIIVVDHDGTASSRDLIRRIDATPDVAVAMTQPDMVSAERAVHAREVSGILVIPQYFERDVLHGRASPIALYADASYFLIYQRVSGAVNGVARTMGAEVEAARLIGAGVDTGLAAAASDPMPLTAIALFNPQGGYATYVLPAALILILQQTLLIGVGLIETSTNSPAQKQQEPQAGAIQTLLGKWLAYLIIETPAFVLYLIILPYLCGIPRLGPFIWVLVLAVPFILAVSGLAMAVAAAMRDPLAVQLALAACGLPFFLLAGFAWPNEAIPEGVKMFAIFIPSTSAIDGIVRVSQMGAMLSDVRSQVLTLWGLALLYGAIAVAINARRAAGYRAALARSATVAD